MKKIATLVIALSLGSILAQAQGTITLANTSVDLAYTNNGVVSGKLFGNFYFTVLDSTSLSLASSATNLSNPSSLALWTWTGVTGTSYATSLNAGKTQGSATAAANWGAPTGSFYNTGTIDSYIVVGWDITEGNNWLTVSNELATSSLVAGGWFGVTPIAQSYSGGGPNTLAAIDVFANTTGISGQGLSSGIVLTLVPSAVPEPSTMALAALGGASLLLFRRRQSKK